MISPDVLISDSGATKCYADRIFVKKANVSIQKFSIEKQVELAEDKKLMCMRSIVFRSISQIGKKL